MENKQSQTKRRIFVFLLVGFVASVAGIGVVWVQSLPKMNIVQGKAVISNCEPPLPTYSIGVCPKLYCKKVIIDSGLFPEPTQIGFAKAKPSADQILHGTIRYRDEGVEAVATKQFLCELEGYRVKELKYVDAAPTDG